MVQLRCCYSNKSHMKLKDKLSAYYVTAIASLLFAVVGFSYNTWRMEVSEDNNNIRTASFVVLTTLAELEQIIFAAHYDQDSIEGNPRRGWVKIGLIVDLSPLVAPSVEEQALQLKKSWSEHWATMASRQDSTEQLIDAIGLVRNKVKSELRLLQ